MSDCETIKNQVQNARQFNYLKNELTREHAYLGQYLKSIDLFNLAIKSIQNWYLKIDLSDEYLRNEWKKLEVSLNDEVRIVHELSQIIQGKPAVSNQQKPHPSQQNQPIQPNYHSQKNQPQYQPQQKPKALNQEPQQYDAQKPLYPFGQVPFMFHHVPEEMKQKMNFERQYVDPTNPNQNYYPQDNQYQNMNPMQQIYQQIGPYENDFDNNNNNNNYQQKRQQQQFKDPDVWDPPTTKPVPKKKVVKKQPQQPTSQSQNDPLNKQNQNQNRNYKKPWLENARQPQSQQQQQNEEKKKNSYLYSVYPDGKGPLADLIQSLETDVVEQNPKIRFDQIASLETAKRVLDEVLIISKYLPENLKGILSPCKGILLYGPPGTGKTLLAKATATQGQRAFFNVPICSLSSKWRGESEKLIKILFDMARFYSPCTLFFDEIDSLMQARGDGDGEASRKVKSELLGQIDGFETTDQQILILGATNRPWDIDDAFIRRLEKRIYIPLPNEEARRQLFEINMKGIQLSEDLKGNWEKLVTKTEGYSGADITQVSFITTHQFIASKVCKDACMQPVRRKIQEFRLSDKLRENDQLNQNLLQQFQQEIDVPITLEDFLKALENVNKSVAGGDIKRYEQWQAEKGSI